MIRSFGNKTAFEIFEYGASKDLPTRYWQRAFDLLDIMSAVDSIAELKLRGFPPNLRLHKLKGRRKSEWSIDIHKLSGWRMTFFFEKNEFVEVKVENSHS